MFKYIKKKENSHELNLSKYDELKNINIFINNFSSDDKKIISFLNLDISLLFFNEDQRFFIVTNKKENDKEYIDLLSLKNIFNYGEKQKHLDDYRYYITKDFLRELKDILDISGNNLEEIVNNYVLFPDNFVKMIIIYLKIISNVPIIIMGGQEIEVQTLISKLSEMKNDGNKDFLKILNITDEFTNDDIINFIKNIVVPEANKIEKNELKIKEKYNKSCITYYEKKLWVLFEEIKPCKSVGLLSEIICNNSCQGEILPSNIVFIAHLNPYSKNGKNYTLIPDSLLNYAIDFGERDH